MGARECWRPSGPGFWADMEAQYKGILMEQVLIRALALLRRPLVAGVLLAVGVGGAMLVRLPLLRVPGFELSQTLTLVLGLFGGGVGIAAARQERRLLQGTG